MHCALAFTSRPGCECNERDVIGGRPAIRELSRLVLHHLLERTGIVAVEAHNAIVESSFALLSKSCISQSECDLRFFGDVFDFTFTQERHRTDYNASRLDHCKPARDHQWVVGVSQQYTIAWDEPKIFNENLGNPIRCFEKLLVGPRSAWIQEDGARTAAAFNHAVQQLTSAVHPVRI